MMIKFFPLSLPTPSRISRASRRGRRPCHRWRNVSKVSPPFLFELPLPIISPSPPPSLPRSCPHFPEGDFLAVLHPENEGFRRNGTRTRQVESCGQDSEEPQGTVNKTDKTMIQDLRQRLACPHVRSQLYVKCFARAWNYYGHLFFFHSFGLRDCFSHDRARISGREGVVTLFVRFTKGVDSSEKERKKYDGRWRQGEEEEEAPNNSLRGLLKENCRHGKTEKKTASQAETWIL